MLFSNPPVIILLSCFLFCSLAKKTWRYQPTSLGYVELRNSAVGTGDPRSAFCWAVAHGNWDEGMLWNRYTGNLEGRGGVTISSYKILEFLVYCNWNWSPFCCRRSHWKDCASASRQAPPHTWRVWWRSAWMKIPASDRASTWSSRSWRKWRVLDKTADRC